MTEMDREPGSYSGGFLFDEKNRRVLLHLRDDKAPVAPNMWSFFGGKSEGDETPMQGFIREMKEELNLDLKEEEVISLWNYMNEKMNTQRHVFYVNKFLPKSDMVLGEGADFDWVSLDELDRYDLTEFTKKDLLRFKSM